MEFAGPDRKRSRQDLYNGSYVDASKAGLTATTTVQAKACMKFFSTSGCPYGEGCHFSHYVQGGISARQASGDGLARSAKMPAGLGMSSVPIPMPDKTTKLGGYKVHLCHFYGTHDGCRFGDQCHFAHGEKELRKSNKSNGNTLSTQSSNGRLTLAYSREPTVGAGLAGGFPGMRDPAFTSAGAAGFLGRRDPTLPSPRAAGFLRMRDPALPSPRAAGFLSMRDPALPSPGAGAAFHREPTPPGMGAAASFGASSTAKISIDANMAGAVIGKSGINAKNISRMTGAKLSIREHESNSNLRNVEMEGTFDQIKNATQMVQELVMNIDPLPPKPAGFGFQNYKTKLCENYPKGSCSFGERCHFAHGEAELHPVRP